MTTPKELFVTNITQTSDRRNPKPRYIITLLQKINLYKADALKMCEESCDIQIF